MLCFKARIWETQTQIALMLPRRYWGQGVPSLPEWPPLRPHDKLLRPLCTQRSAVSSLASGLTLLLSVPTHVCLHVHHPSQYHGEAHPLGGFLLWSHEAFMSAAVLTDQECEHEASAFPKRPELTPPQEFHWPFVSQGQPLSISGNLWSLLLCSPLPSHCCTNPALSFTPK